MSNHERDNKTCALSFLDWRVGAWKADGRWDTFPRGERIHVLRSIARLRRELAVRS